ncbi:MAG: hypothetical protein P8P26_03520 [Porticoccaceae bacterium]|nr:hypothetical protein [Porticoccaceae bacterium]MDG1311111.1 hypothetical protein [Porticoccaceae bacterium]
MALNKQKLKLAEAHFLQCYPGGFANPEMQAIGKKHRVDKMTVLAQESFSEIALGNINVSAENMVKVVSRSSMVSMFEKPKFRDFVGCLNTGDREFMVKSLEQMLHGQQQAGFEAMVDILQTGKLAKWSILTIIPAYFSPTVDVFVKPTTAKNVIRHFEVEELFYKPLPSWSFYTGYRDLINSAKRQVDSGLSPSNAAFSGFLMISMG